MSPTTAPSARPLCSTVAALDVDQGRAVGARRRTAAGGAPGRGRAPTATDGRSPPPPEYRRRRRPPPRPRPAARAGCPGRSACRRGRRRSAGAAAGSALDDDVDELGRADDDLLRRRAGQHLDAPWPSASASASAAASSMPASTSTLSRTLPLTCTTIVTVSTAASVGVGDRPAPARARGSPGWRRSHSSAVTCGAAGASSSSSVSMANGGGALLVEQVHELHERGDGGVVRPALEVVGDPHDQPVGGPVDLDDGVALGRRARRRSAGSASRHTRCRNREAPVDADALPVDVVGRRSRRTGGPGAGRRRRSVSKIVLGRDQVALRLRHLRAAEADHALGEQPGERLAQVLRRVPEVGQRLREEAGVHQVEDGVLDAADVLADRHPLGDGGRVERARPRSTGRRSAGSTRTSRRTCPWCRSRAPRARRSSGRSCAGSPRGASAATRPWAGTRRRRAPAPGSSSSGTGTIAVVGAVHDRDRAAPEALPAQQPVAQAEVDLPLADALGLEPLDGLGLGLDDVQTVEPLAVDGRARRRRTPRRRSRRAAGRCGRSAGRGPRRSPSRAGPGRARP